MAYTTNDTTGQIYLPGVTPSGKWIIDTDSGGRPTTTVSGGAGSGTLTTGDNTGWVQGDIIQLPGGTGGALRAYEVGTCGAPGGVDNTTRVDLRTYSTLAVAVTSVATATYYRIKVGAMPLSVTLTNLTTGVTHKWTRGMARNTAIRGDGTVLANTAIVASAGWVNFHPDLLAANQRMLVEVDYPVSR